MTASKVKIIEGLEEVKAYYYSINQLLDAGEEVLIFGARSGNPRSKESISFFEEYIRERSSKDVKTKILYNVDVQSLGRAYEAIPNVQVRYMPMGLVTKVGVNVYRNTIDMLDWDDPMHPRVIVIEDQHIADSYREYFNMLWSATVAIAELERKGNFWLPEILFEDFVNHSNEKRLVEGAIVDILKAQNPKTLLNVGSGLDTLSKSADFPKNIERIVIVEKNTSYVQAYGETPIEVIHADFEFWETHERYDAILASHVLFYLNDKKAVVQKVMNLLNPGGIAIFVAHEPSKDYKRLKGLVFGFKEEEYVYTYDKLSNTLEDLKYAFEEVKIDCEIQAKSVDELYKVLRLWFEMDLKTYHEHEAEIKDAIKSTGVEYVNSIFMVKK